MQLRDHEGVKGKRDAYPFDPRLLKIEPGYNVRQMDTPDMRAKNLELKESIRANGVKVPLEVRLDGEDVYVIAGHRRHAMVMELIAEGEPIETVLTIGEPKNTNDAERALNLVISNSGEPLKPLEVAEVVRRLTAFGWDKGQVAKRMGWKSTGTVSQHLDMLAMPADLQQAVKAGDVSATMARRLEAEQPGLAAKIIADAKDEQRRLGKKPRATPKAINKARGKPDKLPIPPPKQQQQAPLTERNDETQTPPVVAAPAQQLPGISQNRNDAAGGLAERHHDSAPIAQLNPGIPEPARQGIEKLIEALQPFAEYVRQENLGSRRDDELFEVFIGDIKRAALAYSQATGGEG